MLRDLLWVCCQAPPCPCGLPPLLPYRTCCLFFQGLKEEVKPGHDENRIVPRILLRRPKISAIAQATLSAVFLNQVIPLLMVPGKVSGGSEQKHKLIQDQRTGHGVHSYFYFFKFFFFLLLFHYSRPKFPPLLSPVLPQLPQLLAFWLLVNLAL